MRHVEFGIIADVALTDTFLYNIFCAFPIIKMANSRNSKVEFENLEERIYII
jgi:hypothetical protein